uniref:Uncharacterized protein n=1 Tax=Ralstonia solanacearum TaxID=305 RepID=A0A0S4WNW1_RALSL|nr:protein of unknown function [Ralstonia solanacearum]
MASSSDRKNYVDSTTERDIATPDSSLQFERIDISGNFDNVS